jgi:hypothetical protein
MKTRLLLAAAALLAVAPAPAATSVNDAARFLAGMPTDAGSSLVTPT